MINTMVADKILCDLSDANDVISEAREEWIIEVLMALGVDEDIIEMGFSSEGSDYDTYLHEMDQLGIDVDINSSGNVLVYKKVWLDGGDDELSGWLPVKKQHIVAQWSEPKRTRRIDGKNMYYEIRPVEWHVKR